MEQIERIEYMEQILDELTALTGTLSEAAERYETLRPRIRELSDYYAGEDWKRDFADDEAGKLPADLKRGVLSEDGIYNALSEDRETLARLLDVVSAAIRD